MRCVPEQKNPRVTLVFAALLIFGGITYMLPYICRANEVTISAFPFVMLSLTAIVAVVYIMIRYRMTSYKYIIRLRDDAGIGEEAGLGSVMVGSLDITSCRREVLDFCVYRAQGTRLESLECLLSLGDLVEATRVIRRGKGQGKIPTKNQVRQKHEAHGNFVFYDYTLTFGLEQALELVFIDGNRYVGVIIEADERMQSYLLSLTKKDGKGDI